MEEDLVVDTRGGRRTDRENECPGMGHGARTKNWSRHLHRSRVGSKVSRSWQDLFFFSFSSSHTPTCANENRVINKSTYRRGGMEEDVEGGRGCGRAWSSSVAIFYKADGRNKLKIKSTEEEGQASRHRVNKPLSLSLSLFNSRLLSER